MYPAFGPLQLDTVLVRRFFLGLLILSHFIGGCADVVADPWIEIKVIQDSDKIKFRFFIQKLSRGVTGSSNYSSHEIHLLLVGDSQSVLWEIRRLKEASSDEVIYGVIPNGFEQLVPRDMQPTPLAKGREYQVMAEGGGGATGLTKFIVR